MTHLQNVSQAVCEFIATASASTLVGDDGLSATAVECDRSLHTIEQLKLCLSAIGATYASTLFTAEESVDAWNTSMDHVEHEPVACGIICAERLLVILRPNTILELHLLKYIRHLAIVHSVSVTREHDVRVANIHDERHWLVLIRDDMRLERHDEVDDVLFLALGVVRAAIRQ
jgi:hypothetical protein